MILDVKPPETFLQRFIELREEEGKKGKGILEKGIIGYDIRFIVDEQSMKELKEDSIRILSALEEEFNPDIILLSHDHRKGSKTIEEAYEQFQKSFAGADVVVVKDILNTTAAPFIAHNISATEIAKVLAIHATASHNPSDYNGFKLWFGEVKDEELIAEIDYQRSYKSKELLRIYGEFVDSAAEKRSFDYFIDFNYGSGAVLKKFVKKSFRRAIFYNAELREDFNGLKPEPPLTTDHEGIGFIGDGDFDRGVFYIEKKSIPFSAFLLTAAEEDLWPYNTVLLDMRTPPFVEEKLKEHLKVRRGTIGRNFQEELAKDLKAFWFEENWHTGGFTYNNIYLPWSETPLAISIWLNILSNIKNFEKKIRENASFVIKEYRTKVSFDIFSKEFKKRAKEHGFKEIYGGGYWKNLGNSHVVVRMSKTEIGTLKLYYSGINEQEAEMAKREAIELLENFEKENKP